MRLSLSYEDGEALAPPFGKPLVHVVLFKLKDVSDANVQRTIDKLRSLEGRVPTLRAIEVGSNVVAAERAYDIALIARFDDLAGMEAYQTHPYHQEVLAFMRTVMSSAVAVDYETDA
ncbi:MAG: Dabb family protein [Anaerolineae bacterium]|nr:Dabb family protein [Anaerolineae bacterium]